MDPRFRDRINVAEYDIPSLTDTMEAVGLDLVRHEAEGGTYWNGPCPFHEHEKNHTTFVYYEKIDKCHCLSCHPKYMDSIGLYMLWKNVSFPVAVKEIGVLKSPEEILETRLKAPTEVEVSPYDPFIAVRLRNLVKESDSRYGVRYLRQIMEELKTGSVLSADRILTRAGY
jgi:hypothetical protein